MTLAAPRTGRIALVLVLGDALAISLSFWVAFLIRFRGRIPAYNWEPFLDAFPWLVLGALGVLFAFGLYREEITSQREEFVSICVASGVFLLVGMGVSYAGTTYPIPRSVFMIEAALQGLAVSVVHSAVRTLAGRWAGPTPVIVVGRGKAARRSAQRLTIHARPQWHAEPLDISEEKAWSLLEQSLLPGVWVYLDEGLSPVERERLALTCLEAGARLLVSPSVADIVIHGTGRFLHLGDLLLVVVSPASARADVRAVKRSMDLAGALVLGVLAAPVLALAALAIRLTSPGPVLFRQPRIGLDGRPFTILKFRTMVDDAEAATGPVLATDDDVRITPVGRLLRATRMDELPQIVNILRGEMSLVGPRPERPEFVRRYEAEYPLYRLRHSVKPGLTGVAQVMGDYGMTTEDKLRFDLLYIRNYSFLLDLQVLLWTLKVVFLPERARGVSREADEAEQRVAQAREEVAAGTHQAPETVAASIRNSGTRDDAGV